MRILIVLITILIGIEAQGSCDYACNICFVSYFAIFCWQCKLNRSISEITGKCVCNNGTYESNHTCLSCPFPCKTCGINGTCTSCNQNTNRIANSTVCACQPNYIQINQTICSPIVQEKKPGVNIIMIVGSVVGGFLSLSCSILGFCIYSRRYQNRIHMAVNRNRRHQGNNQTPNIREDNLEETASNFNHIKHNFYKKNETCSICLEGDTIVITQCQHYFHQKCIKSWLSKGKNCPNCNKKIKQKHLEKWCVKCFRNTLQVDNKFNQCQGCLNCQKVIIFQ